MVKKETVRQLKQIAETTKKHHELADKWINTLKDAGYSYEEMLKVFKMARMKLENLNKQ